MKLPLAWREDTFPTGHPIKNVGLSGCLGVFPLLLLFLAGLSTHF